MCRGACLQVFGIAGFEFVCVFGHKAIVKPTALGPVANTDTTLLIDGLFQKGRVLAQDDQHLADIVGRSRVLRSFVLLDTSASSEGWHVQWETVPPGGKVSAP